MSNYWRSFRFAFICISVFELLALTAAAQQDRITARINPAATVVLRGRVPLRAQRAIDQGPVAPAFPLPLVTLYLQPSASQQASLRQLLAAQRNPGSPRFHQWLTPEQYGDQFGVSQADIARITAWLQSQGLTVESVARSRTFVRFSGTAAQINAALHTQIDQYLENGSLHYSNSTDPSVPAALAGMVAGFRGLNDFHLKPRYHMRQAQPLNTTARGDHQIVPDDFATIYNVAPLYAAGIGGTNQSIVVVGQTDVNPQDITTFRTKYVCTPTSPVPCSPNNVQQKLVGPDPGTSQNDLPEADLDIEWAGAVARNATIIYVYSNDVDTSLQDAIDKNYAPVISMSYGLCEEQYGFPFLASDQMLALQANAEGITWLAAAGDNGAGDCEDSSAVVAQDGFAVDTPGSIPEVTSMGGTEFNEGSGNYWSDTNSPTGASAKFYIPERVWNDSELGFGLAAGGGGTSLFFPQPDWQTGPGVPASGYRNVPDLSIAASADHDGYYVETSNKLQVFGGTSLAAPTMAGIVALLNQYLMSTKAIASPGLGNINPELYRLAQVSGVFHDVSTGDNSLPCVSGSPDCVNGTFGFAAAPSYDRASGLGSPNTYNLVHAWVGEDASAAAVVASIDQNPVYEQGGKWPFTITLSEEGGVGATVTNFIVNGAPVDVVSTFGSASIPANGSISSTGLSLSNLSVPANVAIVYQGTDARGNAWGPYTLTIPFLGPQVQITVGGVSNAASGQQAFAPGMLVSVYGLALGNAVQTARTIPLPQYLQGFEASVNGVTAPLYYVSPDQVNLQIPYETPLGSQTLTVGNPYKNVDFRMNVVAAAPGIFIQNGFVFPPYNTAGRGKETALFITGAGRLMPSVATGDAPTSTPNLPKPVLPVAVTVAGENATIDFKATTPGLVGVVQINYIVPADAPLGVQPVVVTVGTASSVPANVTITP